MNVWQEELRGALADLRRDEHFNKTVQNNIYMDTLWFVEGLDPSEPCCWCSWHGLAPQCRLDLVKKHQELTSADHHVPPSLLETRADSAFSVAAPDFQFMLNDPLVFSDSGLSLVSCWTSLDLLFISLFLLVLLSHQLYVVDFIL